MLEFRLFALDKLCEVCLRRKHTNYREVWFFHDLVLNKTVISEAYAPIRIFRASLTIHVNEVIALRFLSRLTQIIVVTVSSESKGVLLKFLFELSLLEALCSRSLKV
jgi:hypothetical protein